MQIPCRSRFFAAGHNRRPRGTPFLSLCRFWAILADGDLSFFRLRPTLRLETVVKRHTEPLSGHPSGTLAADFHSACSYPRLIGSFSFVGIFCRFRIPYPLPADKQNKEGLMAPSFAEILVRQSDGIGKRSATQVQAGTSPSTGREKARGLYPVTECLPKIIQMLEMAVKGINALSDRALVCRFNGYWPKLVDLRSWLDACWKSLLHQTFSIYPCARGFFVIDFDNQEDRYTIVEAEPWFWGSSGLFMQHWSPTFNPSTTSISTVPVWVRLPNLSLHLWNDPSLRAIGNAIGQLHSICPNTTKIFRTTYARICVQMDLSEGLPAELKIVNPDYCGPRLWITKMYHSYAGPITKLDT
jgi:hypothetical protein